MRPTSFISLHKGGESKDQRDLLRDSNERLYSTPEAATETNQSQSSSHGKGTKKEGKAQKEESKKWFMFFSKKKKGRSTSKEELSSSPETGNNTSLPTDEKSNRRAQNFNDYARFEKSRVIRIFLSSPFQGLEQEREEFSKLYLPKLKHKCGKHGVNLYVVDLRWGITEELAKNAQVINICLQEIDRSDIFVGFYAQRYGWHSSTNDDELLKRTFSEASSMYPWIQTFSDRSVTELEYRHGFLNNPKRTPSFFFFRDKNYDDEQLKLQPGEERKYKSETENAGLLLKNLKDEVLKSDTIVYNDYPAPSFLAEKLYDELDEFFSKLFEKRRHLSQMDIENLNHEAFISSQPLDEIFLDEDNNISIMNDFIESTGSNGFYSGEALLVTGSMGTGKTTLLANWCHQFIQNKQNKRKETDLFVYHFVGCSPDSLNYVSILRRCVTHFQERLGVVHKVENNAKELLKELIILLNQARKKKWRTILVIDGLNSLTYQDGLELMRWFPETIFSNAKVILSTTGSDDAGFFNTLTTERKCQMISLNPLTPQTQEHIIDKLLEARGKRLSSLQRLRFLSHPQAENALCLRILTEELCFHGKYETLDSVIESYLESQDIEQIFMKIIDRMEKDYSNSKPDVVGKIFKCVYSAREGLTDFELAEMLNLHLSDFAIIYYAMADYMRSNSGIITFRYKQLRDAIRKRYFSSPQEEIEAASFLADFFFQKLKECENSDFEVDDASALRLINELPWLLTKVEKFQELQEFLIHPYVINQLLRVQNFPKLIYFWNMTNTEPAEMKELYFKTFSLLESKNISSDDIAEGFSQLGTFFTSAGYFNEAEEIILRAEKYFQKFYEENSTDENYTNLISFKNQRATVIIDRGDYVQGIQAHINVSKLSEGHLEKLKNNSAPNLKLIREQTLSLASSYNNIGVSYYAQKQFEKSKEFYQKALAIHSELDPRSRSVAETYNNLMSCHSGLGDYEEAIKCGEVALEIFDEIFMGSPDNDYAGTVMNMALIKKRLGKLEEAEKLYYQVLEIRKKLLGENHVDYADVLNNIAVLSMGTGKDDEALELLNKVATIYEKYYGLQHPSTGFTYENIAIIYLQAGDFEKGYYWEKKAKDLFLSIDQIHLSIASCRRVVSQGLLKAGKDEEAKSWFLTLVPSNYPSTEIIDEPSRKTIPEDFLSLFQLENDPEEANACLQCALTHFPGHPLILAFQFFHQLRNTTDEDEIRTIANQIPEDPGVFSSLFSLLSSIREANKSLIILLKSLELFPSDNVLTYNLALCYGQLGEFQLSTQTFEKYLNIDDNFDDMLAWNNLINVLKLDGKEEEAKSKLKNAIDICKEKNLIDLQNNLENTLLSLN